MDLQHTRPTPFAGLRHRIDLQAVLLIAIFICGIGLRLWNLDERALWLDEAYSKWFSGLDLRYLWWLVPRAETHPPLYYTILKGWRLIAGDSVFALRLLSALSSCATLYIIWRTALELAHILGKPPRSGRWLAIAATGYVAASPILIIGARQARPYGLLVFFFAVSLWAMLRLYRELRDNSQSQSSSKLVWLAYFTGLEMVLWLHSLGVLFALCLSAGLAILLWTIKAEAREWRYFAAGHTCALLMYIPCLSMIVGAASWWTKSTWLPFSASTVWDCFVRLYAIDPITASIAILLLSAALWQAWRERHRQPILGVIAICAVGPFLMALVLSMTVAPVLVYRTLSSVTLSAALLIGTMAVHRDGRSPLFSLCVMLTIALSAGSVMTLRQMIPEDWNAIVGWIDRHRGPKDEIWVYPNDAALPLGYAFSDHGLHPVIRQIPAPYPALAFNGHHPSGSPAVVTASAPQLRAIVESHEGQRPRTIWLLRGVREFYDPQDVLGTLMRQKRRVTASADFDLINVTGFKRADAEPKGE